MMTDSIDIDKLIAVVLKSVSWLNLEKDDYRKRYKKKEIWQQAYEKLKERADIGDIAAIECIFWLDFSYSIWEYFYIKIDPIVRYLDMLPADKASELFKEKSKLIYDYITQIVEPMKNKMAEMKKEIKDLKTQIKYMPGGIGYQEAKHEFDSVANK